MTLFVLFSFYRTKRPDPLIRFYDHVDDVDPVYADDHAISPCVHGDDCVHRKKRPVEHRDHGHDHGEDRCENDDDYAPAEGDNADVNDSRLPADIPQ